MNKPLLGSLTIILGSLVLSLELYGLKILQGLEMQKGSWLANAMDYVKEPPVSLALWITVAVIVYGIVLAIGFEKIKKLWNKIV